MHMCLRVCERVSPARPPHLFAISGRARQFFIRVTVNVHILSTDVAVPSPADPTLGRQKPVKSPGAEPGGRLGFTRASAPMHRPRGRAQGQEALLVGF